MRPEVVEVDGEPVVEHLYLDQIELTPTRCRLHVVRPDNTAIIVEGIDSTGACTVFDGEGTERGSALQLSTELLGIDWVASTSCVRRTTIPSGTSSRAFNSGPPSTSLTTT